MLDQIELSFRRQEATEAKLRQFLSDASHELRTPLTSIQGFAELFRLGVDKDHVNLPIIMRRIEEESLRMRGLVEDLLLLARLDERREPVVAAVDLAVLAADACSDAVAADPDRPVVLHAADPVVVDGDRDHLRQAIANLVNNALRHTAAGTTIEVRASHEPRRKPADGVAPWSRCATTAAASTPMPWPMCSTGSGRPTPPRRPRRRARPVDRGRHRRRARR
ncbi:MAG: histidine kinase dimerization/phospho-acceptor domain-containing protein [Acidimicrobiales bacterium]